ncbi:MAG: GTPase ObgE [Acidimicrobiales bacterium]|jgi:GTP-binding protein
MSGFVDEAQLHVKAGDGGAGAVAMRREAHVDKGGPDGGDGGRGGNVWLVATTNQSSLLPFRDHPHRGADNGGHGGGKKKHGARGADLEVPVPVGTRARRADGTILADLANPGDRWLAGEGGRGGRGNASFLSNNRRAPTFAEQGEKGHEEWYNLELALVADVALVGFPNVGKSTLISRISAAKPKIADYPFTTLEPHLGVVRSDDESNFTVADIPGLVEGAAEGKGLGHQFLRHITRARALVILVELDPVTGVSPAEQHRVLVDELRRYQPELLDRPRLVVGSKADMVAPADLPETTAVETFDRTGPASAGAEADGDHREDHGEGEHSFHPDLVISAVTGQGIPALVGRLATMVEGARTAEPEADGTIVIHRPLPEGFTVERVGEGEFVVLGKVAERAVALNDVTTDEAADYVQGRLRRLGVDRALAKAGARDGDTVHIGELSFTWFRDQPEFTGQPASRRRHR